MARRVHREEKKPPSRRTSKDNTPPRGSMILQSRMLQEVKDFDKTTLLPCSASSSPRRSNSLGSHQGDNRRDSSGGEGGFELKALKDDQVARVCEGVYVGGVGGAKSLDRLLENGVTHIVNCSPVCHHVSHDEFEYLLVTVYDKSTEDIEREFTRTNDFIRSALTDGGVVYVHCYAGQSRSATLVAAYLMSQGHSLREALALVRKNRPKAKPNSGFMEQLERYERRMVGAAAGRRKSSVEEEMFDMELEALELPAGESPVER